MLSLRFLSASLHKHTNRLTIYFRFCTDLPPIPPPLAVPTDQYASAEMEMTVNILIQIDKLVQLLESPVFTCKIPP